MIDIVLSTRNPSKAEQIKTIFIGLPISVLTLSEAGIQGEALEDGETLKDNALKKARYAFEHVATGSWAMSDDTGLFIHALNDEPGVKSARWAGEGAATEEITRYCLDRLKSKENRSASFESVVALISPDGQEYFFSGKVNGVIVEKQKVPAQPKMPYSPLFKPEGSDKVWAEMTVEEENAISHRGKAFRQVREFLEKQLSIRR